MATTSASSNPDTLVLNLSEDAYGGDAQFSVTVDGKQLATPQSVTASHAAGQSQAFAFNGDFGSGSHSVGIAFVNDAYGGTSSTDRNLYIDSATFDGTQVQGAALLYRNGTVTFATGTTNAPAAMPATASTSALSGSGETFAPSARGGSLLPSGYLSTNGNQVVDAAGNPVRIDAIGWYGTDGPAGSALQGLWSTSYGQILGSIKGDGFNAVRIPWSDADLNTSFAGTNALGGVDWSQNADLKGLTTLQAFGKIVDYSGKIGLKVIFDHHTDDGSGGQQPNGLWIDKGPGTDGAGVQGTVDTAKFQADWVQIAKTFAGNSTVIGFDLDNEPTEGGGAHWGGGGPTDIQQMYQAVGNAVGAVDPGALVIAEGPIAWGQHGFHGADLSQAAINPVKLSIPDKLVYSVHEYPHEIGGTPIPDSGPAYVADMSARWGFLEAQNIAPVWVGEMGSNMTSAGSKAWASTLLDYMNGKDGAQGGPTFSGNQTAWGPGHYKPEQQAVTDQMLFKPS